MGWLENQKTRIIRMCYAWACNFFVLESKTIWPTSESRPTDGAQQTNCSHEFVRFSTKFYIFNTSWLYHSSCDSDDEKMRFYIADIVRFASHVRGDALDARISYEVNVFTEF